ncbi:MAG: YbaB/EbfC family nucleoid-associated protein [Micrococcales bacterium]|nr:YbaB/EbfC family nucleoid-associated protein [Micrococcales bacterium]
MTGPDLHRFDGDTPAQPELNRLIEDARRAVAWRASLSSLTGTAEVEGVRVVVNGNGGLHTLTVSDEACSEGGDVVSGLILRAVHAAQQDLAQGVRRTGRETFGARSPQARTVATALEAKFGSIGEVLPQRPDIDIT